MKEYCEKTIITELADVDMKSRTTVTKWSAFDNKDSDNEVITKGAYTKTISERGPQATNLIWHLVDHNRSLKSAIAKPTEIYENSTHLVGVTKFPNTTLANDMIELYADGHINQHSVGFVPMKEQQKGGYNEINEIMLYEGSAVLWGANWDTGTVSASKSIFSDLSIDVLEQEYERTLKSIRNGTFTDETFSLLEIKLRQLWQAQQNLIKSLTDKQPHQSTGDIEPIVPKTIFTLLSQRN